MSWIDSYWEGLLKLAVFIILGLILSGFVLGSAWLVLKLAGADVSV